jgi:sugar O-acyltransferase (sialic acid O-acetyltransferase NeuD family)
MMKLPGDVVVIGAGGHAKVVIATVRAAGGEVTQVLDDDSARWGERILGVPVDGPVSDDAVANRPAVIAVGSNRARQALARRLQANWITACHPSAIVHSSVSLGPGTVVFAAAVVQPDAQIGAHAIINTAASVDHDCVLGDFVHVGPGTRLCGGVTIDEGALLGVGVSAAPNVGIGAWSTVGAGAVCVRDVPSDTTVTGVPARATEANG